MTDSTLIYVILLHCNLCLQANSYYSGAMIIFPFLIVANIAIPFLLTLKSTRSSLYPAGSFRQFSLSILNTLTDAICQVSPRVATLRCIRYSIPSNNNLPAPAGKPGESFITTLFIATFKNESGTCMPLIPFTCKSIKRCPKKEDDLLLSQYLLLILRHYFKPWMFPAILF